MRRASRQRVFTACFYCVDNPQTRLRPSHFHIGNKRTTASKVDEISIQLDKTRTLLDKNSMKMPLRRSNRNKRKKKTIESDSLEQNPVHDGRCNEIVSSSDSTLKDHDPQEQRGTNKKRKLVDHGHDDNEKKVRASNALTIKSKGSRLQRKKVVFFSPWNPKYGQHVLCQLSSASIFCPAYNPRLYQ